MSRSQQNETYQSSQDQNKQASGNAESSYKLAQENAGNYQSELAKFEAGDPYTQGGEFETAQNQQLADTAAAGAQSAGEAIQGAAVRSGGNPGQAIAATEAIANQNDRNLASQEAEATAQRLGAKTAYGQTVVGATGAGEQQQQNLMSAENARAQGALGTQEDAARTPSFTDMLGQGMIQTGVGFASSYCPAEGSRLLMHDGDQKAVEAVQVGDVLWGIDGDPETVVDIRPSRAMVVRVETDDRCVLRCSRSHAFALQFGGFVEAARALNRKIITELGIARVIKVEPDGVATVYNVISDGSHTYRANGMWSLGVGEVEGQQVETAENVEAR